MNITKKDLKDIWDNTIFICCTIVMIVLIPKIGSTQSLDNELIRAATIGDAKAVKLLLKEGADANAMDNLKNTALGCAIQSENEDCVHELLNNGADVNQLSYVGYPPLVLATLKGKKEMVKAILSKGADINIKDPYQWTALMNAVYLNKIEIAKILIDEGADVNVVNYAGRSALFIAENTGNKDMITLLKSAGAK